MTRMRTAFLVLILLFLLPAVPGWAGAPDVPDPTCAGCGGRNGNHSSSCPYMKGYGGGSSGKSRGLSPEASFKVQMTGMIFESLLMSIFSDGSANAKAQEEARARAAALAAEQMAAEQAARAAAAQAAYDRMMQSYKRLEGSEGVAFKTLSGSAAGYKTLGGGDEALAAGARSPFDSAGSAPESGLKPLGEATPFFGDTMPVADIRLLVDPESDSRVADLRQASAFVVKSLKEEQDRPKGEPAGKAAPSPADCRKLGDRLQGMLSRREKFQKTVLQAQEQLDTWEQANRNALLNGVKDGLEYFAGQYLDALSRRGKAADRLKAILERNSARMAKDGLDTDLLARKIEILRLSSAAGQASELANGLNDWTTFCKDGLSSLMSALSSSDAEIREMMKDPRMEKYITAEAPELNALLDISKLAASSSVFGKWVAKKIPLVAGLELSVKQAYNATDWLLSFRRVAEANRINGQVAAAARSLQANIDEARLAMEGCP